MVVALAAMQLFAAPVDQVSAMRTAKSFLTNELYAGKMMASEAINPVLVKTGMSDIKKGQPVYYIFNTSTTYLVISGDDRAREVLMVGDQPLDLNHMPDALNYLLDCYKEQIEYLQAHPGKVVEKGYYNNNPSLNATTYGPLLTCNWDQTAPYWNDCVFTYGGSSYQCLTGCAATSAAMVMYYWKYPTAATPTVPSYVFYLDDNYSRRITAAELPSTTFDWANMKNTYRTYSTAQAAAVAKLMRYVGQAEKMGYGTEGSGIPSSEPSRVSNAFKLFGYDSNTRAISKSAYSQANWNMVIQNEIAGGRPIVYLALSNNYGHAFNVDGYNGNTDLYHVNFGWSGYGNNWFAMNAFTDSDGEVFNQNQRAIVGIQPPGGEITYPILNADTEAIDFGEVRVGESVSRTVHVTGMNLLTDVTFTKSGAATFSVSPESLTAAQVEAGADITVTYTPTAAAASQTATLYIKSPGAPDIAIPLSASAVAIPTITVDKTEMSFTAAVGETVTSTFHLQGYALTSAVYLSVLNTRTGFSINKSNVTINAALNGAEVTVTYAPTAAGTRNTRIMLRSTGADTIYIALSGTATMVTHNPVMLPANAAYTTTNSFRAEWTDETNEMCVESYTLEYSTGGRTYSVTDLEEKEYVLSGLTPGATYAYKVKAFYIDGSESAWSNTQYVTLSQGHAYEAGDVNHDGVVAIADVSVLIDYLLDSNNPICLLCADVNNDNFINISDVSALIDKLLN